MRASAVEAYLDISPFAACDRVDAVGFPRMQLGEAGSIFSSFVDLICSYAGWERTDAKATVSKFVAG